MMDKPEYFFKGVWTWLERRQITLYIFLTSVMFRKYKYLDRTIQEDHCPVECPLLSVIPAK